MGRMICKCGRKLTGAYKVTCINCYVTNWREKNRPKYNAYMKKYYKKNKKRLNIYKRGYSKTQQFYNAQINYNFRKLTKKNKTEKLKELRRMV